MSPLLPIALAASLAALDVQPDSPAICPGQAIVLDAGPGYRSYSWSTGETTQAISVSPSATTEYSVTVDDAGDPVSDSEIVRVNPPPMPWVETVGPACSDPGQPTTFVLDASSTAFGSPIVEWRWSADPPAFLSGTSSYAWLDLPPGFAGCVRVALTVVDQNGCSGSWERQLCVSPAPQPVIDAAPSSVCSRQDEAAVFVLDASGSAAWSPIGAWRWWASAGTLSSDRDPTTTLWLPPGFVGCATVSVEVLDTNGCVGIVARELCVRPGPATAAAAGPDRSGCAGSEVVIGSPEVAGWTYRWSPAVGLDRDDVARPRASVVGETLYTLSVTDAEGCSGEDSVLVVALPAGLPDAMDNALRCLRRGGDLEHAWTGREWPQTYRVERATRPDLGDAVLVGEVSGDRLLEPGAVTQAGARYYRMAGSGCP